MHNLVDLPRAVQQKDVNAMPVYKEETKAIMFINKKHQKQKTAAPESVIPMTRPRPRSWCQIKSEKKTSKKREGLKVMKQKHRYYNHKRFLCSCTLT